MYGEVQFMESMPHWQQWPERPHQTLQAFEPCYNHPACSAGWQILVILTDSIVFFVSRKVGSFWLISQANWLINTGQRCDISVGYISKADNGWLEFIVPRICYRQNDAGQVTIFSTEMTNHKLYMASTQLSVKFMFCLLPDQFPPRKFSRIFSETH